MAEGSYREKDEAAIKGSGWVVESLEAALWCFWHGEGFEDTILRAANLGDDADTTAAIAGQLAGAYYGADAVPKAWRERLAFTKRSPPWPSTLRRDPMTQRDTKAFEAHYLELLERLYAFGDRRSEARDALNHRIGGFIEAGLLTEITSAERPQALTNENAPAYL